MKNVERGIDIDPNRLVDAIDILTNSIRLSYDQYLRMAVFVYKFGGQQDALPYFLKFAENAPVGEDSLPRIIQELTDAGHNEWADQLREIQRAKQDGEVR